MSTSNLQCNHIQNLDLEYLTQRLVHKENWNIDEANEAVRKYKNFLKLKALFPKLSCVPTYEIDEVWHAHILHTKQYTNDCMEIFGNYIHHAPASPTGEDEEKMKQLYRETARIYESTFNESYMHCLDVSVW